MAQESAYTSTRQIPALFKLDVLEGVNLDFGGGRYDDGSDYLAEKCVLNIVYDPFCRSQEHNDKAMSDFDSLTFNSITCLNVLNVIRDDKERMTTLKTLLNMAETGDIKKVYIQIYEGDRSGVMHLKNAQMNRKTKDYLGEIMEVFNGWGYELIGKSKKNIILLTPK